jgi:hypothetical protein
MALSVPAGIAPRTFPGLNRATLSAEMFCLLVIMMSFSLSATTGRLLAGHYMRISATAYSGYSHNIPAA